MPVSLPARLTYGRKNMKSRKKKTKCLRGHDTTCTNSRYKQGGCKACKKENNDSPEGKKRLAKWSAYRVSPRGKAAARVYSLKLSGWTPAMVEVTLVEQGNACAICRKTFTATPHTDHKHGVPPEPRALLCGNCNRGIGIFLESPETLRAAADYVEAWA